MKLEFLSYRVLAAPLLAYMIFGAQAFAQSSGAAAKPYSIEPGSLMAGPPRSSIVPGTVRRLSLGDAIFEAPVVWTKAGEISDGLNVEIAGLNLHVSPGQTLAAATATGGDLAGLAAAATVLCTRSYEGLRDRAVSAANARSRYNKSGSLCLVDSDADSRFDKAFTDGSKLAADWHMVDIPATSYKVAEMVPHESGVVIKVVYAHGLMFRPVGLQAEPWVNGEHPRFTWAKLKSPDGSDGKGRWPFKGATPRRIAIGGAEISLLSFDPTTGIAEIRYERDFSPVEFVPESDEPTIPYTIYY